MIFLHPSAIMFISLILTSILMILSADSWFMIWIFLEVNLLLFIPLMFMKKSKYQSEAALKYFINQAMSSVIILSSISFMPRHTLLAGLFLCAAFSLKMGVAPLHGWLVAVASSISWTSLWLLLIIQKIAPMLVFNVLIDSVSFLLISVFITATAIVGGWGGLSNPNMKKIMTYSSITQMAWLLTALSSATNYWVIYFFIYSSITTVILASLAFMKISKLNDLVSKNNKTMKMLTIINMLSISGLPPLSGFMMKLSLILGVLNTTKTFVLMPLVGSSLVALFFYLRIFYLSFITEISKKKNENKVALEKVFILTNTLFIPMGVVVFF